MQVDAALTLDGCPERADEVDLSARHLPALDRVRTFIERLVFAKVVRTFFKAAVDDQVRSGTSGAATLMGETRKGEAECKLRDR
jgi:hypothetical protein